MVKLLKGTRHISRSRPRMSALELGAILGHMAWFGFLNRHSLVSLDSVYSVTSTKSTTKLHLELDALTELATFMGLGPMLEVDLQRPWQDFLIATDASVDYGFGVSVAHLAPKFVRAVGQVAERPKRLVRLDRDGGPDDEPVRPRKCRELRVPVAKSAFSVVVSSRRRYAGHPSSLEAHGIALGLKWALWSVGRHSKRTVLLVDAQAVMGAVAKGRSSARCLTRDVAHIGALAMAGDLILKLVYIPSEDNPEDAPTRGVV